MGTSGSSALKIGIGARATGMGEASVALADDVSSIYWNPAGLYQIRSSQLSAMHIEWLDDIRYEWLAYAQPLASWGTIAADVSYVYMGSIPRTIESFTEGYESDGTFTMADMAGRIAFGSRIMKDLLAGASVQVLQSRANFDNVIKGPISNRTAQATAISFGCLYNTPVPELTVGCNFQNLGRQTRAFFKENDPMPFVFKLGVAYKMSALGLKTKVSEAKPEQPAEAGEGNTAVPPQNNQGKPPRILVLAMDLNFAIENSVNARMGAEYRFGSGFAIRGGYRTGTGFDFPSGLCAGVGYNTSSYQLDYALTPYGNIGNTHRVSFTIRFY